MAGHMMKFMSLDQITESAVQQLNFDLVLLLLKYESPMTVPVLHEKQIMSSATTLLGTYLQNTIAIKLHCCRKECI